MEPMKVATNQFNSLANTTNCSEAKPECRQHTHTRTHTITHTHIYTMKRGNNASRTSLEPCTEADQSCTINWSGRPLIVKTKATATTTATRTITKTTNKRATATKETTTNRRGNNWFAQLLCKRKYSQIPHKMQPEGAHNGWMEWKAPEARKEEGMLHTHPYRHYDHASLKLYSSLAHKSFFLRNSEWPTIWGGLWKQS